MTPVLIAVFVACCVLLIYVICLCRNCGCSKFRTVTYSAFKKAHVNVNGNVGKIPKVVFRTGPFHMCKAPDVVKSYLEDLVQKNPQFTQVYFDDHDCRQFVRDYFNEYLDAYDSLVPTAFKADLFRLLALYQFGGVYNDIGHLYTQNDRRQPGV